MTAKIYTLLTSTLLIVALTLVITTPQTHAQQPVSLQDGDLIQVSGEIDVYIVKIINGKYFKRLILNPEIFNSYGHLRWDNIQQVTQNTANSFQTSNFVREVYPNGTPVNNNTYALFPHQDTGIKRLVVGGTYDPDSVYNINHLEAGEAFYATGEPITLGNTAQPQTSTYTNAYLLINSIQNTARKRSDCSDNLLGLENIVGNKLLVPDDVCIKYLPSPPSAQSTTLFGTYRFNNVRGIVEVYTDKATTTQQKQHTLLHELCHANQHYHLQRNSTYDWDFTPAGQQFISIARYSYSPNKLPHYKLPTNSIFLGKYGENQPIELAADVCAMFLAPALSTHRYSQTAINTITSNADALSWFNTYVLYNAQNPESIPPLHIQPLTQQQKQQIYADINLVVSTAQSNAPIMPILEMALFRLKGYNDSAHQYVKSILPNLLEINTVSLSISSNELLQQRQELQNELNRLGTQINNLKNQINAQQQQGVIINNLITQHNDLVDQYNALIPQVRTKTTQAQTARNQEIANTRTRFVVEILQEWLDQLIETGEV